MAIPALIGKYEILATMSGGGMSVVYRAQDSRMGRKVAIKIVTEGVSNDAGMLQRFYREAEKMRMLKHPNIITVYDQGEQDGFPYIVTEFVEGDSLDRLIQSNQPLSLLYKLRIIEQVCGALGYAHHNDLVHRDVKPANVIVRPDGVVQLLGFGIAQQAENNVDHSPAATGGVIGTGPHMAPERLNGAQFDGRSDIFATGVLLYQLLTGRLPFPGEGLELVSQLLNEKHRPLSEHIQDYPQALDQIIQRSLEKNPADRYQTAEEMAADLNSITETLKRDYPEQLILQTKKLSSASDLVIRQTDEAAQRAKVKTLLDTAKDALQQRNYLAVLDLVEQVETIDASNLELQNLTSAANEGLFLEDRRRQLDEIEGLLSTMVSYDDVEQVANIVREALERSPADATLLRYQAQIDRRLREHETKRLVDDTLKHCRATMDKAPLEALEVVRSALKLLPGDERLMTLEEVIQDRISQRSPEETRSSILLQAREALKQRKFAEAATILDQCKGTIRTNEIFELLDYARQEAQREQRQQYLAHCYTEAQDLLRDERYEEIVALLGPALKSGDDAKLRTMLEQARSELNQRNAEQAAAVGLVQPFVNAEHHEQVIAVIQALPSRPAATMEMQAHRVSAQEAWKEEWTQLEKLGQAYAALATGYVDNPSLTLEGSKNSTLLEGMNKAFANRRMAAVDQILLSQMKGVWTSKDAELEVSSLEAFAANKGLLAFASDTVGGEWSLLADQSLGGKKAANFLARFGKRSI
jgi:eukaryotic-like serine/threonine-protein kinase